MSEEVKNIEVVPEISSQGDDLILKSVSKFEIRRGNGKFLFEFNTKVESGDEKSFMELCKGFGEFVQSLTRTRYER